MASSPQVLLAAPIRARRPGDQATRRSIPLRECSNVCGHVELHFRSTSSPLQTSAFSRSLHYARASCTSAGPSENNGLGPGGADRPYPSPASRCLSSAACFYYLEVAEPHRQIRRLRSARPERQAPPHPAHSVDVQLRNVTGREYVYVWYDSFFWEEARPMFSPSAGRSAFVSVTVKL